MVRDSLDVCIYKHLPIVYCLIYWDVLVLSFCFLRPCRLASLLPFGIFGEPTTLDTLLLLEEFEDRPETRECNNSKNNR